MSIFEWHRIDLERLTGGSMFIHGVGDVATSEIAQDMFRAAGQADEEEQGRLARTRWLEGNRAEYSFRCGVVPEPTPKPREPQLNVLPMMRRTVAPVIAAVLPFDLVFLLEQDAEDVVELGRLPRNAIRDTDVVDPDGTHIAEPTHETVESDRLALAVLRWSNADVDEQERFAFRSVWLAWKAAHRLLGAGSVM